MMSIKTNVVTSINIFNLYYKVSSKCFSSIVTALCHTIWLLYICPDLRTNTLGRKFGQNRLKSWLMDNCCIQTSYGQIYFSSITAIDVHVCLLLMNFPSITTIIWNWKQWFNTFRCKRVRRFFTRSLNWGHVTISDMYAVFKIFSREHGQTTDKLSTWNMICCDKHPQPSFDQNSIFDSAKI